MYIDHSVASYGIIPLIVGAVTATASLPLLRPRSRHANILKWFLYTLGTAIYNITFHPLAKFPGPKFRGASTLPEAYSSWSGRQTEEVRQMHDKYGPVVRVTPHALSFATAQAWKDIYGFRPGKKQMIKDPTFYVRDPHDHLPSNLIIADDAAHSRGRRLLANAFSDNALREQEEILTHYFDLFVSRLREQVDGPNNGKVNMVGWYNFTTFDIIGDLTFGESFHALENRDYHPWIRNIFQAIKFVSWLRIAGLYPAVKALLGYYIAIFPSVRKARADHINFVRNKTEARLDIETDRKDFITFIQRGTSEKGMSRGEIISNSSLLIIAGSETTATLLSGATYHLLRNPSTLSRLQAEVRGAFSSTDDISLIAVGKLPYLHAVIEESLRMYPPVPIILPRRTPPGGEMVDGHFVPGGTALGVHQWSTNRSASNFADPDTFAPERWLHGDDLPERFRGDNRAATQPFSTGPRNCLGKNLAYNEMRAILARAVLYFDWELMEESRDWNQQKTFTLWEKPELMVRLTHRKKGD